MENKTPLYKRRILIIPLVALMMIVFVSAAVIFAQSHATIKVTEALNATLAVAISPSGYPGETISRDINITSLSSVDLPIEISWSETANTVNVEYTYTGPTSMDITANTTSIITLTWDITSGSPAGDFEGDITLTRI